MLLAIIVIFSHLSATNGEKVYCNTNVTRDNQAAEGDSVIYRCETTHSGSRNASLVWYQWIDKQWLQISPIPVPTRGRLSNTYAGKTYFPKTSTLTCILCYPSKGGCTSTDDTCATKEYAVLYSVRSISTWPILYASPGEELTCSAKGNPDPTYSWERKEDGGKWVKAGEGGKITGELSANSTSASSIYKCIAKNEVRGRPYKIESPEIVVTVGGATKRWIIIGVVLGVIAVIAIIGAIGYFLSQ